MLYAFNFARGFSIALQRQHDGRLRVRSSRCPMPTFSVPVCASHQPPCIHCHFSLPETQNYKSDSGRAPGMHSDASESYRKRQTPPLTGPKAAAPSSVQRQHKEPTRMDGDSVRKASVGGRSPAGTPHKAATASHVRICPQSAPYMYKGARWSPRLNHDALHACWFGLPRVPLPRVRRANVHFSRTRRNRDEY